MIKATLRFPEYQAVIAGAPGIDKEFYHSIIKDKNVHITFDQTYEILQHAKAAVVNSGTATLETALIGTPEVVVYNVYFGRLMMLLKDYFVKVKYISLVNLVAQKEVVKELMAQFFTVENVSKELDNLLHDKIYRQNMLDEYASMKKLLGEPGAASRAAKIMVESLTASRK
jgi:lipid-A-disaccharide synthase